MGHALEHMKIVIQPPYSHDSLTSVVGGGDSGQSYWTPNVWETPGLGDTKRSKSSDQVQ